MNPSIATRAENMGMMLVIVSILVSWIVAVVIGGFKFGSLEKRLSLDVAKGELAAFLERLNHRLAELGFQSGAAEGQFVQGGAAGGEIPSFTHAKTKKQLSVAVSGEGLPKATVELRLRYLDPVVGDSGESAYRDAVLDYVSGATEEMRVVPNQSFMALSCLVGGAFAWVAFFFLVAIHFNPIWWPITILGVTELGIGVLAILSIKRKPSELIGTRLAIIGMALSAALLVVVGVMALLAPRTFPEQTFRAVNSCVNNLRQIDGAKSQWALEYNKDKDATPTLEDLRVYLGRGKGVILECPDGGTYIPGRVGEPPRCSLGGPHHSLPDSN